MDSGVQSTQRIVITIAILLGIIVILIVGYSLYTKAKIAEGELAKKTALDNQVKRQGSEAIVSLTGEANNSAAFTYDGLVRKKEESVATTSNFEIVNENGPVEVPEEITPIEDPVPPEEPIVPVRRVVQPVNTDRPLTAAEIEAIRKLPIDNSPSGNLQTSLEEETGGQYKARY